MKANSLKNSAVKSDIQINNLNNQNRASNSNDKKEDKLKITLLQKLRDRDKPLLATDDAHGPG